MSLAEWSQILASIGRLTAPLSSSVLGRNGLCVWLRYGHLVTPCPPVRLYALCCARSRLPNQGCLLLCRLAASRARTCSNSAVLCHNHCHRISPSSRAFSAKTECSALYR